MYKCLDCGRVFETPKEYVEEEQIYAGCPDRECRGAYVQAFKCILCEDWKEYDQIYYNICEECARMAYTPRLGLKYVDEFEPTLKPLDSYDRSFYLWEYGIDKVDRDYKKRLIKILQNDFITKVDMDTDWNHELKDLKEYCLNDMDTWIDFLKEEI